MCPSSQYTVDTISASIWKLTSTYSYRLNIFGFSGAPGETQNVGLLDQRKAIEWVYQNIAGFGGDPSRISIMGQSAGGSAVDYYSYAYADNPLVAGLISHSGTALGFTPNTPEFSQASFLTAAQSLGCSGANVTTCMRAQDYKAVLDAVAKVKPLASAALAQPVFHPTVDGKTVFADYKALSHAGKFAKIVSYPPLFPYTPPHTHTLPHTRTFPHTPQSTPTPAYAPPPFPTNPPKPYLAGNVNNEDGFYHVVAAGQNLTLTPAQWTLFDLEGFICAASTETAARAKYSVPTWRYMYFGTWPNLELYPGSGTYHGSDLHMIFGGAQDVTGIPNTVFEDWTSAYMMWAWASFVRDPAHGLSERAFWPVYDPRGNTMVRLGLNNNPGPSFVAAHYWNSQCPANGSVAGAQGAF